MKMITREVIKVSRGAKVFCWTGGVWVWWMGGGWSWMLCFNAKRKRNEKKCDFYHTKGQFFKRMLYFRFENPRRSHIPPNHIPQLLHSPPSIEIWHKKRKMWRKKVWITQHWFSFNLKISLNPVSQAIFCETKYCVFAENFFIPVL